VTLQRLVITFKSEEFVIHALYRIQDGSSPGTKARTRVVANLAREGLRQALACLESEADAEQVGCSGFTQREDVLVAATSPSADKLAKGAKWKRSWHVPKWQTPSWCA
jgi:hypothetical protein